MRKLRKLSLLIALALSLGTLSPSSWAAFPTMGEAAPNFLVVSGDNQKLTLDMLRGKVVVFFYESRHAIKANTPLKDELIRFYQAQTADIKQQVFRLVVIDCANSTLPTAPVWRSKLREHSRQEGFTIYGDWNRKVLADYCMKAEESNFLIIDKNGIIRYGATGKINPGQFETIKALLLTLVQAG
jgi:hypothetical protein